MSELAGIADAADENRVVHFVWAHRGTPGMRAHVDDHLVMTDSGLVSETFNTISRVRFPRPGDPRRVQDAIAWYAEEGRPFSWWVGPADYPTDLGRILLDAGLRTAEQHLAMGINLDKLPPAGIEALGLEMQRVTTVAQLKACATINAAHRSPPDPLVQRFFDLTAERLLMPRSPRRFYLGLVDGVPVTTAEVTITGRVAGLYNVTTLPTQRRQGVGFATGLFALHEAARAGSMFGVLHAPPDTEELLERTGFETFGRITEFRPERRQRLGTLPG